MEKRFEIDAKAISVNSQYVITKYGIALSKEARLLKNKIVDVIGFVNYEYVGNVKVSIETYYKGKGNDCDNPIKLIIDALTEANVFKDDDIVSEVNAKVFRYCESDKIVIVVEGVLSSYVAKEEYIVFDTLKDVDLYLIEKIREGKKVVRANNIYYDGDVKYLCVSKRQLKKIG